MLPKVLEISGVMALKFRMLSMLVLGGVTATAD